MQKKASRSDRDAPQPYARLLEASARLNMAMRQTDSRRHALDTLLAQSLQAFSADAAGTYEVQDGYLVFTSGRGLLVPPPPRLPVGAPSVLNQALHSEHVLYFKIAAEPDGDCDFCGFLKGQGMKCLLVTPLRTAQATIGVLFIALHKEILLSEGIRQLLNAFSEAGGSTLHRFMVMNQLELTVANRDRELQVLYDLMAITAETSEVDKLLYQSLDRILLAVDCPVGVIHLVDPVERRLKAAARAQYSEQFDSYLELSGLSGQLWQKVYADQTQVQVRSLPDRSFPEVPNLEGQYYTYLGVPICIKGKAVGVLSLFGRPDLLLEAVGQLAKSAADELGLAVESGRLRRQAEDAVILHERQRMARNLHDSVSQSLYALVISADVSEKLLRIKDFPGLRQELKDIGKVALQGLKEMRLMLYEFRPASLESAGLAGALEQRLNTVEGRAGIDVALSVDKNINLSPQMEQEIYQIAIEALNNSLKHAEATAVSVDLRKEGNVLQLDIQDNGRGFDASTSSAMGGMGLNDMRERARILGGELVISSAPGKGSLICFKAPFPKAL